MGHPVPWAQTILYLVAKGCLLLVHQILHLVAWDRYHGPIRYFIWQLGVVASYWTTRYFIWQLGIVTMGTYDTLFGSCGQLAIVPLNTSFDSFAVTSHWPIRYFIWQLEQESLDVVKFISILTKKCSFIVCTLY